VNGGNKVGSERYRSSRYRRVNVKTEKQISNIYNNDNQNESENDLKNSNRAQVAHSGNSDVNVHINIQVDVKPLAMAILYSLLATKQLSQEDFELGIRKLNEYKYPK